MNKAEYLLACRQAQYLYVYIQIVPERKVSLRVSKAAAWKFVRQLDDDDKIDAVWSTDHKTLIIGEGHGQI